MICKKPLIFWVTLSLALHVIILAWCPAPGFFSPPHPVYLVVDLFSGPATSGTGHGLDAKPGGGGKPTAAATVPSKKSMQSLPARPKRTATCEPQELQSSPTPKTVHTEILSKQDSAPTEPEASKTFREQPPETNASPNSVIPPVVGVTAEPLSDRQENVGQGQEIVDGSDTGGDTGEGTGSGTGPGSGPGSGVGQGGQAGSGSPVETPFAYGSNPPPPYPSTARRRGWEGEVLLLVEVSAQGKVCKISVRRSSGYRILDRTAINAVYRWRFQAAMRNGRAVPGQVLVPIRFDLKELD